MALDAAALLTNTYCLDEVSKNVEGEVFVLDAAQKSCHQPTCESLMLVQRLRLDLSSNGPPCDSSLGTKLDGVMRVGNLTTVFTGPGENLRGVHAANFSWNFVGGGFVSGTLEGITNAGIVRSPKFQPCERCNQTGILTGHLFATGINVPGIPVTDFHVDAVYRLAWDPLATIHGTASVIGTLEGVIIMPCQ